MATLEDIAKALGTTKGTVSKALNGAQDISDATRKTILDKAVELGYSKITRKQEGNIVIFLSHMNWETPEDFGYDIVMGFRQLAEPKGYHVDIVVLDRTLQKSMPYDSYMLLHNYKGAFFLGLTYNEPWLQDFPSAKTPLVLLDAMAEKNPNITTIGVDSTEGFALAVEHLKKLGHRNIGYIGGGLGSYIYQQRYLAFIHAIKKFHLPYNPKLARHSHDLSIQIGTDLPYLLENHCTAIVCSHDSLAHAAMTACKDKGLSIPEDISIVGYDDLPFTKSTYPPMTTIRQDRTALGKSAFFALSSHFEEVAINCVQLHAELVIRKSTGLLEA